MNLIIDDKGNYYDEFGMLYRFTDDPERTYYWVEIDLTELLENPEYKHFN